MYQKPDFIRVNINVSDNFASYATTTVPTTTTTAPTKPACEADYGAEDHSLYHYIGINAVTPTCTKELVGELNIVQNDYIWVVDDPVSCYFSLEAPAGM